MSEPPERLAEIRAHAAARSAAYKTVDIFAGIARRKLWLRSSETPGTDGNEICAPFFHSSFYRMVEIQLAHILFRSDPQAARVFSETYADKVSEVGEKTGVALNREEVERLLTQLVAQLERHRVVSLWEMLYAGSVEDIRRLDREAVALEAERAHDGLLLYLACLNGDPDSVPPGELDHLAPYILEAFRKVRLRDASATLMVAKWLVLRLVDQLLAEAREEPKPSGSSGQPAAPPQRERAEALAALLELCGEDPPILRGLSREAQGSRQRHSPRSAALAAAALRAPVRDDHKLDQMLERSSERMQQRLDDIRREIRQRPHHDVWLQKDAMAKVRLIDEPRTRNAQLSWRDRQAVVRLQTQLIRVMGRRRTTLEDQGAELDVGAYIERRTTGLPVPCFRANALNRGFRSLLLLDRSSSMSHSKMLQCQRAHTIISRALRFPFVDSIVWGFSSQTAGEVSITRYSSRTDAPLSRAGPGGGGGTPLHLAIRLAARELLSGTAIGHLFLVTDGFPTYARRDGRKFGTPQLMRFVREEVRRARAQGVGVTGILLGSRILPGAPARFDLTPQQLAYMFGPQRFWRMVRPERIDTDLVELVASSFVRFVRQG